MRSLTLYGIPGKMTRRLAGVVIGTQGLAVFFGALWLMALVQGRAMDAHTQRVVAQWHETPEPSGHSAQSEPSTQDG